MPRDELAATPAGERNERLYKTAFRLATGEQPLLGRRLAQHRGKRLALVDVVQHGRDRGEPDLLGGVVTLAATAVNANYDTPAPPEAEAFWHWTCVCGFVELPEAYSTGSSATGPCGVKRSYARPPCGLSVATIPITACWP